MSAKVTTEVWDHAPDSLSSDEMLCLIKLADYADPEKRFAWPHVETLGKKIHKSVRSTQRILRGLVEKNCLGIYDRPGHASAYIMQNLAEPHSWPEKIRWNGNTFVKRAYNPVNIKPYGALRKKSSPPPDVSAPIEATKITPIRPKRHTSHTTRPTKYFSLEERAQK